MERRNTLQQSGHKLIQLCTVFRIRGALSIAVARQGAHVPCNVTMRILCSNGARINKHIRRLGSAYSD